MALLSPVLLHLKQRHVSYFAVYRNEHKTQLLRIHAFSKISFIPLRLQTNRIIRRTVLINQNRLYTVFRFNVVLL